MEKEALYAYTAGLFDGEGTITLSKHTSKSQFRHPVVTLTSTTYELVQMLKDNFGGHIVKQKTYKINHKQSWAWHIVSDNAIDFLEKIIKYLQEPQKVYRAKMIIEVYKTVTMRNGKYSEEAKKAKTQFENDFFVVIS